MINVCHSDTPTTETDPDSKPSSSTSSVRGYLSSCFKIQTKQKETETNGRTLRSCRLPYLPWAQSHRHLLCGCCITGRALVSCGHYWGLSPDTCLTLWASVKPLPKLECAWVWTASSIDWGLVSSFVWPGCAWHPSVCHPRTEASASVYASPGKG